MDLSLLDRKQCPTKVTGVYALKYRGNIIYIGQSKDIRQRLNTHARAAYQLEKLEENKDRRDPLAYQIQKARYEFIRDNESRITFTYIPVPSELLDEVEQQEIQKYKPVFNYQGIYDGQN